MATDGTIVIDIRTSGNEKALEVFKDELMALTVTGTNYNASQSVTNYLLLETNSLILTQGLLITGLSVELSTTAVIAQQIFAAQTEITRMSLDTVAQEISTVLVPQLDGLLTWFNTNMPTFNTVAGDVFRGMVLALAGIGATISFIVIPQLTSLFDWMAKNSQKMNENFGIAFNGAKTVVGELATSLNNVNGALKTLRENNKGDVDAIKSLRAAFGTSNDNDVLRTFGDVIIDVAGALAVVNAPLAAVVAFVGLLVKYSKKLVEFFNYSQKQTKYSLDEYITAGATSYKNKTYDLGLNAPAKAEGTPYLPNDMIALVHEGEMIVPKSQNPYAGANRIKAAMNASSADVAAAKNTTNNITYTFNSPKALGMSEILQQMRLAEQRKVLLGV